MSKRPDTALRNKSLAQRKALSVSWVDPKVRAARSVGISKSMKGNTNGRFRAGIKYTTEAIERMRISHLGQKAWNKGTGAPEKERDRIRHSKEYTEWRTAVFKRDGYACVIGGRAHGNKLQADHIKPFSKFPELRFVISNGRTLCIPCHQATPTYGHRPKSYQLP